MAQRYESNCLVRFPKRIEIKEEILKELLRLLFQKNMNENTYM